MIFALFRSTSRPSHGGGNTGGNTDAAGKEGGGADAGGATNTPVHHPRDRMRHPAQPGTDNNPKGGHNVSSPPISPGVGHHGAGDRGGAGRAVDGVVMASSTVGGIDDNTPINPAPGNPATVSIHSSSQCCGFFRRRRKKQKSPTRRT